MAILKGKLKNSNGDVLYPETSADKVTGLADALDELDSKMSKMKVADYKTLYHLGAYDTVDTSNPDYDVITRRTGYLTINADNIRSTSVNAATGSGVNFVLTDLEIPASDASIAYGDQMGVSSNGYPVLRLSYYWSVSMSIGSSATGEVDDRSVYIANNNLTTVDQFKALCPIVCQFQLDSAYQQTEKVIKNRPLDTLDQKGSMFVRKEWEKGLNLIDYSKRLTEKGINPSGVIVDYSGYYAIDSISCKPNTRYSHNFYGTAYPYVFFYNETTFISSLALTNTTSFTTPANCNIFKFQLYNSVTTPMVNEGSNPYPYQPYNGDIVRENELSNYVTLNGSNTGSGDLSYESNVTVEGITYRVGSYLAQDGHLGAYKRNLSTNTQYGLNINATGLTYNDTYGGLHVCNLSFGNSGTIAVTSDIPTKVSQLTNDSGYITSNGTVFWNNVLNRPTRLTAFINDAGYVTSSGKVAQAVFADTAATADSADTGCEELLWENGNPTANFAAQTITLSASLSNFTYLIICSKDTKSFDTLRIDRFKVLNITSSARLILGEMPGNYYARPIVVTSATTLDIGPGYGSGSTDYSMRVPIAIYGTNML